VAGDAPKPQSTFNSDLLAVLRAMLDRLRALEARAEKAEAELVALRRDMALADRVARLEARNG
jgi:hypothetical protein